MVTEEVAREALLSFVNSKCCYGSSAAGDLIIQELKQQTLCRVRELGLAGAMMWTGRKGSGEGAVCVNGGDEVPPAISQV